MDSGGYAEPVVIDGRFQLLGKLGGGGMGLVWRAYDLALHREVALKEVRSGGPGDPEDYSTGNIMRERVLREARALARLHHPNVVTIFHVIDVTELRHPWLVMELVTGGSLEQRLREGPLDPGDAARIGRGVLAALTAAHEAGIQHRDVKPGNVLLRPDGTPVLTDFGIAALQDSTPLTATGSIIGSPEYMAPERLHGREGDPASDLWSLGVLLYVAVEGYNPLHRATTMATLAAVMDAAIPQPTRAGRLTPALAAMLTRDPSARPRADVLDRMLGEAAAGGATGLGASAAGWYGGPATGGAGADPGRTPGGTQGGGTRPPASGPQYPPSQPPSYFHDQPGIQDHQPRDSAPHSHAGPSGPAGRGRGRFGTAVGLTAAAGLIGAVLWAVHPWSGTQSPGTSASDHGPGTPAAHASTAASSGATGPTPTSPAATPTTDPGGGADGGDANLLTPAGVEAMIKAMPSVIGTTRAYLVTIYPTRIEIEAAGKSTPRGAYDNYEYANGVLQFDSSGEDLDDGEVSVDLNSVDWNVLPGLIQQSDTELNVTNPTDHYVILDPNWAFADGPSLLVYCENAYGAGYLAADTHGHVLRKYPAGS
jgi:serine/threonine protein kinase